MNLKKGDVLELTIEKIVAGGEGLGYYGDFAVFAPMSVPGDRLSLRLISVKKTYARGLIEKILVSGPERVGGTENISFEDWQGCDFAMLRYEAQLKYKKIIVEETLKGVGKLSGVVVADVAPSPQITHYRNKIIEPFRRQQGKLITGFFRRRSHEVFAVRENPLNSVLGNRIIEALTALCDEAGLSVYDETSGKGLLRHVMIRTNEAGQAMVVLVTNSGAAGKKETQVLHRLKDKFPEIRSLYISLNDRATNVAIGKKNVHLWGEKTLREEIAGIRFHISPLSFFQINVKQAANLYRKAISLFGDIRGKTLVDAFSGTGTLAMLMAGEAGRVIAIEAVPEASEDGRRTAAENKIKNIDFMTGAVEDLLPKLTAGGEILDGVLFDPPRKGLDRHIPEVLAASGIPCIVYISCDPATFARDARALTTLGYDLTEVFPFDMFPMVSHVECAARFDRKQLTQQEA
ncbi:MAG: 23S rRNA (uracil(1939)-C(5))-methyltransferase RlmD [Fusobacteriaceae bacterium]|jgi:23S rRNA (uracil1939-C5)-methyltransferase|nr:23S rRNA (uracil(1939)-C(5))-methyltransferase RlmD [Fusobacteriaceae bacterium]